MLKYTQIRNGESRWGEVLENSPWDRPDVRYVLVGIPEDIGVRANGGVAGAAHTPEAVFRALCNLQSNRWTPSGVGLWGLVEVDDLQHLSQGLDSRQSADLERLRELTSEVDNRVQSVLLSIFQAGKIPVVLGGGHNNAYPLLAAAFAHRGAPLDALNLDAHTDWRPLEGRHSGNGFTAARQAGVLSHYAVWGLQESYTPEALWNDFAGDSKRSYATYESFAVRQEWSEDDAFARCLQFLRPDAPFGLEVDVDVASNFPSSAQSATGVGVQSLRQKVYQAAQTQRPAYLHLCEAHAIDPEGRPIPGVAKALAALVVDFIRGMEAPLE